jgi:hypothetical protein
VMGAGWEMGGEKRAETRGPWPSPRSPNECVEAQAETRGTRKEHEGGKEKGRREKTEEDASCWLGRGLNGGGFRRFEFAVVRLRAGVHGQEQD